MPRRIGDITHALSPGQVQDLISAFLESETKLSGSNQVTFSRPRLNVRLYQFYRDFGREGLREVQGLHIAAHFGLCNGIVALLASGHDPNCRDSDGWTPLWWAARSGHDKAIEILLAAGEVDPDPMDSQYESTTLMLAAQNGHVAVARLLLETGRVEADCRSKRYFYRGRTPPTYAAEKGHKAVVDLLLKMDTVDPDSTERHGGRTPLSYAAEKGHEAVVKLLLATGRVNPDSRYTEHSSYSSDSEDSELRTLLSFTAEGGHETVVELLLETGQVDPDSKAGGHSWYFDKVRTPLSHAAQKRHVGVVKLLLATTQIPSPIVTKDRHHYRTQQREGTQKWLSYFCLVTKLIQTLRVTVGEHRCRSRQRRGMRR